VVKALYELDDAESHMEAVRAAEMVRDKLALLAIERKPLDDFDIVLVHRAFGILSRHLLFERLACITRSGEPKHLEG
jgi:hypothetical protein